MRKLIAVAVAAAMFGVPGFAADEGKNVAYGKIKEAVVEPYAGDPDVVYEIEFSEVGSGSSACERIEFFANSKGIWNGKDGKFRKMICRKM